MQRLEETPALEAPAYLPSLGISSMVHFAGFLLLFLFAPGLELPKAADETVLWTPPVVTPPQPEPPPEAVKPPVVPDDAPRDDADRDGPNKTQDATHNLAQMKDIDLSDNIETAGGKDEGKASGDPNQRGLVEAALDVNSFVLSRGMPSVRGLRNGTGTNERLGDRGPDGRRNLTMLYDPSSVTSDAVKHALAWLQRHQSPDGHWDVDAYDARCKGGHCTGAGTADYDVAVTGLALLAFLGHGDVGHAPGPYQDTVRRGLAWLKGQQSPDGCIGDRNLHKQLYNHAIATMALTEAVGMGDYASKAATQNAMNYLVQCQNAGLGWRYTNYNVAGVPAEEGGNNDTSVTGWAFWALKMGREAGLTVPDAVFQGASAWLDRVVDVSADYKGTFGYTRARVFVHKAPYTTTAIGVLLRTMTGRGNGREEGVATLLDNLPDWKRANLYYWYYATEALFQVRGEAWTTWNAAMKKALCGSQETQGCEDGSWDPAQDTWGGEGGRIYTTAMGALCLEVYYRYKRETTVQDGGKPTP